MYLGERLRVHDNIAAFSERGEFEVRRPAGAFQATGRSL
jgi:hypothetical protein